MLAGVRLSPRWLHAAIWEAPMTSVRLILRALCRLCFGISSLVAASTIPARRNPADGRERAERDARRSRGAGSSDRSTQGGGCAHRPFSFCQDRSGQPGICRATIRAGHQDRSVRLIRKIAGCIPVSPVIRRPCSVWRLLPDPAVHNWTRVELFLQISNAEMRSIGRRSTANSLYPAKGKFSVVENYGSFVERILTP
jgi:hypothetical protein